MKYYESILNIVNLDFNHWKMAAYADPILREVVSLLDGVPQALRYHPEFDTLKHVYLVIRAIKISGHTHLLESALLHDVGKSVSTNVGKDRMYSYGHAKDSAEWIQDKRDFITDFDLTHDIILRHMDYNSPDNKNLKDDLNLRVFVQADKIDSRRMYGEIFSLTDKFLNYFREKWAYQTYRLSGKEVIIGVGISGSGKSTYFKKNYGKSIIVSPDSIRRELTGDVSCHDKEDEVWSKVVSDMKKVLERSNRVVLDATNTVKYLRVRFMSNFNHCKKTAIVFHIDSDDAIKRVEDDLVNNVDRSAISAGSIRKQYKNLSRGFNSLEHEFHKIVEIT